MDINQNYREAVKTIKEAILRSQYRAATSVNKEQLSLYYGIGRYVSKNSRIGFWGKGAIEQISSLLQKELPGLRGFSTSNIKNMRVFYEEWEPVLIRQPLADEFNWSDFFSIGFSHHIEIISKAKTLEARLFYIHECAIRYWSKYTLRDYLKADLYSHRGTLPNNFAQTLPDTKQALKAVCSFKDEYLLDFINVEELDEQEEDLDEKIVEKSIVANVKKFIMTFGQDFSFIGNQYRVEVAGEEMFIDLLFFNRELNSLVAVELKSGKFRSSYLGQLNTYLSVLDSYVRKPHENPSIGIILCREMNQTFVEFAVRDYNKPMGVATYRTSKDMPERLRNALPDIEELRKLL
ncbi:PDDEXK nuclease domain-containing protein [Bacteroides thetaiotaomicron]|uniref:PDDEXK nuclease domain-containing protein n=1 Tax=Bacteroides thetaiotaomicron TaxID=818 RepID=UPI00232A8945|nr:PDDEXK nuclease domain-containing protein [Bacteroides thetaiotaomicron]MDC2014031.1 PDDEXK nuclease domain-containing protein [Bacteroides thetaiotaomicron]MDC2018597.1 PDDEXK nuclease domain-containing protein [Bacteroides thetaiotaomicron]MDC2033342.1 PDDEXK nuclease domain-containing protein [Bacteroides thetaiotaomicron]MDC2038556.1 PDDEXK nuclease domain-containing protein [Bacteroides thetaiotaomicron]MDC2042174.1 PDDEXK nuclease domain-containing protein [Bacteroides thetaiotaomicro